MIKTHDVVNEIIQEANEKFAPVLRLDDDSYAGLMICCDIVDDLINRKGLVEYEFKVDEDTTDIVFRLKMDELILQHNDSLDNGVLNAILAAKGFSVGKIRGEDFISIKLTYPGIWKRAL